MARFIVELSLTTSPSFTRARVIRRSTVERAILYAEKWLGESVRVKRFTMTGHDYWTVYEVSNDGTKSRVATGTTYEDYILYPKGPSGKEPTRSARKGAVKRGVVGNQHVSKRGVKTTSYMSRMQQAVEDAKARRTNNGVIPRVGSDTHD